MDYLRDFWAGAFLCNCLPHLLAGLQGQQFPTPLAKPRGVGNSSATINFVWGSTNLILGLVLLRGHIQFAATAPDVVFLVLGFLLLGLFVSRHFEKVAQGTLRGSLRP